MLLNLRPLWTRISRDGRRSPRPRSAHNAFRPQLENLEERTLLSQSGPLPPVVLEGSTILRFAAQNSILLGDPSGNAVLTTTTTWDPDSGLAILGGAGDFTAPGSAHPVLLALGDLNGDGN